MLSFDLQTTYIALSALIAVVIWMESAMLRNNGGKMPEHTVFFVLSLISSLWVLVTGLAWFFLDFEGLTQSVPVVYAIYTIAGWVHSVKLVRGAPEVSGPEDLVFPARYLAFSQSFALVFFVLCLLVLFAPQRLAIFGFGAR